MKQLTRRGLLRLATSGAASSAMCNLLPEARAFGLSNFAGISSAADSSGPSASGVIFEDDFERSTLAAKPPYSIIADARGAPRWLHVPTIIEGRDGVLLSAWGNNGMAGDNDVSNFIQVSRSTDRGLTWSEPETACPPSTINPTFIRTRSGDPVLFFNLNHSVRQDDCSIAFRRSKTNGVTWEDMQTVDIGAKVAILVNNGLTLPNGDWLISFQYDRSGQSGEFDISQCDYVAAVAISSDEGVTWRRYGSLVIPNLSHSPNNGSLAVEPTVFPLSNETLGMILRTENGRLYRSASHDQGRTWSDPSPMSFSNDNSKANALTLSNGNIALFWNDASLLDGSRRYPLLGSLSTDGGLAWFRSLCLEDDNVLLDYPTGIQVHGSIKVVYGYNRQQIRLVSLTEDDFCDWVTVNNSAAWSVRNGALSFAGGPEPENSLDWLRWSKAIAFLVDKPMEFSLSVDLRFDKPPTREGSLAIFPAYQDESNWTAWVWEPGLGRAGLEHEVHWGSIVRPAYALNSSDFYRQNISAPRPGVWYSLLLKARRGQIEYQVMDRESRRVLLSNSNPVAWEGGFIALGARQLPVSFDNVVVR